jgi:hypothetical protein
LDRPLTHAKRPDYLPIGRLFIYVGSFLIDNQGNALILTKNGVGYI